jgi:hypothetical protein
MDEIKAYNPTLRQKTQAFVQDALKRMGMSTYGANRAAYGITGGGSQNMGMGLLDFTPLGLAYGLQEGAQAIDRGMDIGGVDGAIEGGFGALEVGLNALPAAAATRPIARRVGAAIKKNLGQNSLLMD